MLPKLNLLLLLAFIAYFAWLEAVVSLFLLGFMLLVLIALFAHAWISRRFPSAPRPPRGVHFSPASAAWASARFSTELQPVAAFVAETLCEQLGVDLTELEPHTTFIEDLKMDDLEPVEVIMALEEDLGVEIPDEAAESLNTIAGLVEYLHGCIQESSRNAE